jgi:hypothetical protein
MVSNVAEEVECFRIMKSVHIGKEGRVYFLFIENMLGVIHSVWSSGRTRN